MKVICIGRNYAAHAREMKAEVPSEPVLFMKPDTAVLKEKEFYYPSFTKELHHECELVIRVSKAGKHIEEQFAHKYWEEIGMGIDFTARDVQAGLKKEGLPWEKAKAFDNSAPVGQFLKKSDLETGNINFRLEVNGEVKQKGNTSNMLFSFDRIISYASQFFSLKVGDLIFTGTPEGVGPVSIGDRLEGFINDKPVFQLKIK
jgi:acylpyruvate hydrolase